MNHPPQLSDEEYTRFRDLILERTGMWFGSRRRDALARAVAAAADRAGARSLGEYYRRLQQAHTESPLWEVLISTLTVGETYFFRNAAHFEALRQHILPELIAHHRGDRRLRIWSAGCASGEEPYSIAILLRELLPDIARWNLFILGTDIDKRALQQARAGCYRAWSFRQTEPAVQERYFTQRDGLYELKPEIREMVTFAYLNLMEDVYPSLATNTNAMDLILCRNVAIYLPREVMREVTARFYRCLLPGGWLMVGASETGSRTYDQFTVRNFPGATLYQKPQRSKDQRIATMPPQGSMKHKNGISAEQDGILAYRVFFRAERNEIRGQGERGIGRQEDGERSFRLSVSSPRRSAASPALPDKLYQEGLALLGQKRDEEALQCFLACIGRDPGFAPAYYQVARLYANRGRLAEARSWCQQALERDPLLVEARYTLALIHQEAGVPDEAIAQLKKVLYLEPDFVLAHFSLANLYRQMGRPDQAAHHRALALRLAASMPPDAVVPGADGLIAGRLLAMLQAAP